MIRIKPVIENIYFCPVCKLKLKLLDFHLTGMRSFVEGECHKCGNQYYVDMPVGHGIFYPVTINKTTRQIFFKPGTDWFANQFIKSLENEKVTNLKIKKILRQRKSDYVVINCLDFLYGHALCKLFNASRFKYKKLKGNKGILVIVSANFLHLIPDFVDQIWSIDMPLRQTAHWNSTLDQHFHDFVKENQSVFLSAAYPSAPYFNPFDLNDYTKLSLEKNAQPNTIVFVYRPDRTWGNNAIKQKSNILALFNYLIKELPNAKFILTGFADNHFFPDYIQDNRVKTFDTKSEKAELKLYSNAFCVIGVHGSNMLLPSALAKTVVDLLPLEKVGNFSQDYMINDAYPNAYENINRFITVHGDAMLSNINPKPVAYFVIDLWKNFDWRVKEIELGKKADIISSEKAQAYWDKRDYSHNPDLGLNTNFVVKLTRFIDK